MALPFTDEQRQSIRARLFESARRHALDTGVRKTSLEALTADAGISKSSFYKFYDSKEQLFLEVGASWECEILARATAALAASGATGDKERAAAMVLCVFRAIHEMGIARFLREDLPLLMPYLPEGVARAHYLASAESIFSALCAAKIRFTVPDETALSVIQLMYLSILHIGEIGDSFFPALRDLVHSACDRLVAG